ncbi:DUF3987 domain-containing protein [Streptomyces sp. NPDC004732]|uniref:DUF3987 domain-containing protein n=1 Tax=Streptomyces sp. NPDC004732 TaxID=3154290 RepID=UPI0033A8BFBF
MAFEEPKGRPRLGKKAYHGIAGKILKYVEPHTEADPAGVLGTLISGYSCMIGNERMVHGPIKQHINVWTILMGETGNGRKGTATDLGEEILRPASPLFWDDNTTTSLSSGEGLIYSVRDGMDEDEVAERLEANLKIDRGVWDKRLFVVSTEFATIMSKSHGGTLGPVMRDAWDGKNLNIHTKDSEVATHPHITILGHVTPNEFADRLKPSEMAGGTWNRYLPLYVHMTQELAWPEPPDDYDEQLRVFGDDIGKAIRYAREGAEPVTFQPAAKKFYTESIYAEYNDTSGDTEVMKQFTTRRLPYLLRVAAVYALMNHRDKISKADLEAAKAVIDYAIESARYVAKEFNSGKGRDRSKTVPLSEDREMLSHALKQAGDEGLTRTHILTKVLKFRRSSAEVAGLIEAVGAIEKKRHNPSGGPPFRIVYHPDHFQAEEPSNLDKPLS